MITWAAYSEPQRCIAFVDTCEMPAIVHVIKFKSNGMAAYRYIMHKVTGKIRRRTFSARFRCALSHSFLVREYPTVLNRKRESARRTT